MAIWRHSVTIEQLNNRSEQTMLQQLGIHFTEIGDDYLRAEMPVDRRTRQPAGILHGGASVALAETLGSLAATLVVGLENGNCVGLEINANHLRPMADGKVIGTARPVHLGQKTQVWDIRISNQDDQLVCISRLTVAVLPAGPENED